MQVFKETIEREYIVLLNDVPNSVIHYEGKPAELVLSDFSTITAGCLRCANPRCMYLSSQEISCDEITDFPNDGNVNVCPVGAVKWDRDLGHPAINNDLCFGCGLCMKRCPVGALYYSKGKILINTEIAECQQKVPAKRQNVEKQEKQIEEITKERKWGCYIREGCGKAIRLAYDKLNRLNSNYHNLVVRNLLIGIGCRSAMRRIGDVYTRMDAVYSSKDGAFGAIEVEFGRDTLDASRGILDDMAVLNTRYKIGKNSETPLVVCLQLPNARQGYWQVVKDINNVEGIKINTVSIGALLLLLWNNADVNMADNPFYADYDRMEIRTKLEEILDGDIDLPIRDLGILEPIK
jgi:NAD-dependent dihydropyrimidine dehydrogenase PreA subunit